MNRRGFLGALGAMIGGVVLEQAIPFNRVWSFPTEVKVQTASLQDLTVVYYDRKMLAALHANLFFNEAFSYREPPRPNGTMMKLFSYEPIEREDYIRI